MPELDEKVKSANCNKKVTLTLSQQKFEILNKFDDPFQSSTLLCYISLCIEMYEDDNLHNWATK